MDPLPTSQKKSTLLPGFQSQPNLGHSKILSSHANFTNPPPSDTCLSASGIHPLPCTFSSARNTVVKYYNKIMRKIPFPLSENLSNSDQQAHLWPPCTNHRNKTARSWPPHCTFLSRSQNKICPTQEFRTTWCFLRSLSRASIPSYRVSSLDTTVSGREGEPTEVASISRPHRPYSCHSKHYFLKSLFSCV